MGSPAFAVPSLSALIEAGYDIVTVMTQPDRPSGRGSKVQFGPVKARAVDANIPVFQPETLKNDAVVEHIAGLKADVFVVAAYGKIIPRSILSLPARGAVNVHASLLPKWRGASPIEAAILAGDAETGVTIMEVVAKMDAGAMVAMAATPILAIDTTATLEPRLAEIGAGLLVEALPGWYDRQLEPRPQDESSATYCTLIRKDDGVIAASTTVARAERMVRAYNPWPGATVGYGEARMTIWSAHVATEEQAPDAGLLKVSGKQLLLGLADGWLALDEVQRPGGNRMTGWAFVNGEKAKGGVQERAWLA